MMRKMEPPLWMTRDAIRRGTKTGELAYRRIDD